MKTNPKSKAGLALAAVAAFGLCVPAAYAAPGDHRRGGSSVHRPSVQHAPQRHQTRHHQNRDRDRDSAGLGLILGIAALGALIIATQADAEPAPVYAPAQPYYPPATYNHPGAYGHMPQSPSPNTWYYCAEQNAYYPHVQHCSGPWQQVQPRR